MKLTREEMLANLGSRDVSLNGKYIVGVHSTGIYCLPSCPARVPKPENVKFYAGCADAEAAGLRPCKKCRPDDYERGENHELDALESLIQRVRSNPGDFACVPELAESLGVGATKLHELIRNHYHATPGELLLQARLERAKQRLLEADEGIAQTAYEVGFESLSVFNDNFKRRCGLTPSEYRGLRNAVEFRIQLPSGYNLELFLHSFGRDAESPTERLSGRSAILATPSGALGELEFGSVIRARVERGQAFDFYDTVSRVLGLSQEPKGFEQLAIERGFNQLIEGRKGARIPQTLSLFDGLIWAIVGQQVNLPFAFALRRRLFHRYGEPVGRGLFAIPKPDRLAAIDVSELLSMQFSRRKAEYMIGVSQLGEKWAASLATLSATRNSTTLLNTRGLGVWSANYIMMRSLGFMDCVPYGDTGLTAGMVKALGLDQKPDRQEVEERMAAFSPWRSMATYHLWQHLK